MTKKRSLLLVVLMAVTVLTSLNLPSPKAEADIYDTMCATAAAGNGGVRGYGRFIGSAIIPAGGNGTATYRTSVCNGSNTTIRDFTLTSGNGCIVATPLGPATPPYQCGALTYPPAPVWTYTAPFYYQDMGVLAPHTVANRDVTITVNGAVFGNTGNYTIRVQGRGRVYDQTAGCFYPDDCYGETNVIDVDLDLFIQRPAVTCGALGLNPLNPEPGNNVTVTMNLSISAGSIDTGTYPLDIVVDPPTGANQTYPAVAYTPSPASGPASISHPIPTVANAPPGIYTVTGTLRGPAWFTPITCATTFTVGNRPFFVVKGGDVATGITTGGVGCQGWGVGNGAIVDTLESWNQLSTPNTGAGTTLATMSRGIIRDFASAQGRASAPSPPLGLSFANSLGFYGGLFMTGVPCPYDYFGEGATIPKTNLVGSYTPNSTNSVYSATGPFQINGTSVFPIGLSYRPIIYVTGDVYINGSIAFTAGAASIGQLPNFYLVVKGGNIFIAPNVRRLDGVYVAQPDLSTGLGGKIYTCAFLSGLTWRPPTTNELNTACRNRELTVNGAFIAKELKFYRSLGGLGSNTPAETFNTTPATWLAAPCAIAGCAPGSVKPGDDAITSLPPIL